MSWTQSVFSSMISSVGYDTDSNELLVTFSRNGKTAAYQGVPEDKANELANAPSVGQMFLSEIRDAFPFRYV